MMLSRQSDLHLGIGGCVDGLHWGVYIVGTNLDYLGCCDEQFLQLVKSHDTISQNDAVNYGELH